MKTILFLMALTSLLFACRDPGRKGSLGDFYVLNSSATLTYFGDQTAAPGKCVKVSEKDFPLTIKTDKDGKVATLDEEAGHYQWTGHGAIRVYAAESFIKSCNKKGPYWIRNSSGALADIAGGALENAQCMEVDEDDFPLTVKTKDAEGKYTVETGKIGEKDQGAHYTWDGTSATPVSESGEDDFVEKCKNWSVTSI